MLGDDCLDRAGVPLETYAPWYPVGADDASRDLLGDMDSRTSAEILDLLVSLQQRYGMTVLVATHEQHVAARCDRIVRLRDGGVVEDLDLTDGESLETTFTRANGLRP